MAQTLITPQELTRRFLDVLHSNCVIVKNTDLQYEQRFASGGYDGQKIGPTLQIRKPNQFTVRSGWPMAQQDLTEPYASLTIDTPRGVDLNFPDADLALRVDDFESRYIEPAAKRLASEVDSIAGLYIKNNTSQMGGTAGTQPNTTLIFAEAAKKLKNALVPIDGNISCIICPDTEAVLVGGLTPLQVNPSADISRIWKEGAMSNMLGFTWYMSQVLSSQTCGTRTNTTPLVNGATQGTAGTVLIKGAGVSPTWTVGDVFTMAGCYEINPETKQTLSYLKQFTVTTAGNADGSGDGTVAFTPALVISGPYQNCSGYPTNEGAVTWVGTASKVYSNDIIMHKKAFAFAAAPLMMPRGMDMAASSEKEGLKIRFVRGYDIINARMLSRMDIFFGIASLRPEWSTRVIGYGV